MEQERMENLENQEKAYEEYVTFTVTTRDGSEVEMAVVDEFEFEKKYYVVGALIKDDEISDEGVYIYRCHVTGDDFTTEQITDMKEYEKVAEAYSKL